MNDITEKVASVLNREPPNARKLKEQQAYYLKLKKEGIAVKQEYNVKPISAI